MKIVSQTEKMLHLSSDLLALSREIRQSGNELSEIEKCLRSFSGLEECRQDLYRQRYNIELMTANVVNLSNALLQIADIYTVAESRNTDTLEDARPRHTGIIRGSLYDGSNVRSQIQTILKIQGG